MKNDLLKRDYPLSETKFGEGDDKKKSSAAKQAIKTQKPIVKKTTKPDEEHDMGYWNKLQIQVPYGPMHEYFHKKYKESKK
jgi:hypothetical protein